MTCEYYEFQVHAGELQPAIPTESKFRDYRRLSVLEPFVLPIVTRVRPQIFAAY